MGVPEDGTPRKKAADAPKKTPVKVIDPNQKNGITSYFKAAPTTPSKVKAEAAAGS